MNIAQLYVYSPLVVDEWLINQVAHTCERRVGQKQLYLCNIQIIAKNTPPMIANAAPKDARHNVDFGPAT